MIEKKETYKLLLEKMNILDKRINKLFNLLVIIPLVYFLLKYSLISEIEINIFKIEQTSFLLLITPLIYSSIFLYSSFLEGNKARIKVFVLEMEEEDDYSFESRY
jgi:ACR3 family arsenite efflux pump ArsB